jgi:hypothetical protein
MVPSSCPSLTNVSFCHKSSSDEKTQPQTRKKIKRNKKDKPFAVKEGIISLYCKAFEMVILKILKVEIFCC